MRSRNNSNGSDRRSKTKREIRIEHISFKKHTVKIQPENSIETESDDSKKNRKNARVKQA